MTARKKIRFTILMLLLLLLAGGVGVLSLFYLLPRRLRQSELPDYLERNQRVFRIGSITSGNYNSIAIRLFSVGSPDAPLLTAPEAVLHFDYPPERKFHQVRFRELELRDVPLRVEFAPDGVRLNGHPAALFLTALTELPPGPDGGFMDLRISARLTGPGKPEPEPCSIQMTRESHSGCFTFFGRWGEPGGRGGQWQARLDRASGELTFQTRDALSLRFWREVLRRAELPAGFVRLFRDGDFRGSGSFSVDFPSFSPKLLRFNGRLEKGVLEWRGLRLAPKEPLGFTLAGTPENLEFSWDTLVLDAPLPIRMQDLQMHYRARRAGSRFSARLDVGPALLQTVARRFGASWHTLRPLTARITGRINWQTGEWQCSSEEPEQSARQWLMQNGQDGQLALTAERFSFSGKGVGRRGEYEAAASFRDLEFKHSAGVWRSGRGELRGTWRFPGKNVPPAIITEFHLDRLSADTPHGQWEFGAPAGELDFRTPADGQNEFYLITRAESCHFLLPAMQLDGGKIQSEISAVRRDADGSWALQACDVSGESAEIRCLKHTIQVARPEVRGNAQFAPDGVMKKAEWNILGQQIGGGEADFTAPKLKLVRSGEPAAPPWAAEFTFSKGLVGPEKTRWRALTGKLAASGDSLFVLPDEVHFTAEDFRPRGTRFRSEWNDTDWKLKRVAGTRDYTGKVSAGSLHLELPQGRSSSGRTDLDFRVSLGASGRPERGEVRFAAVNPTWHGGLQQYGGEHLAGSVRFDPESCSAQAKIRQGTLIDRHLSLLVPEVECSGAGSGGEFGGHVKFSGGRASSDITNLECSDVALDMPFVLQTAPERPRPECSGRLSVGKLSFLGRPEGSLQADLTQTADGLRAVGKLNVAKWENGVMDFRADLRWEPRYLHGVFAMPMAKLREPIELRHWFPGCAATLLSGEFAMEGTVESTPDGGRIGGAVRTRGSDWQIGSALLEGVSGAMDFTDLRRLISGQDAELRARRFRWKQWELCDNLFQLALHGGRTAAVSVWKGSCQTGSVQLAAPVRFAWGKDAPPSSALRFAVENMPVSAMLANLGVDAVEGTAGLSGTVRAEYRDGKLLFRDSSLGFRAPAGELLKFGALEHYAVTMADANYQAFTLAVMKAIRCTSAQFDFADDEDFLRMKIKAEGVPEHPVPFVYQGNNAAIPFRPASPGERGFDSELELLINLKLKPAPFRPPALPEAGAKPL